MSEMVGMPREKLLEMMRDNSREQAINTSRNVMSGMKDALTSAAKERVSLWEFIAHMDEFEFELVQQIEDNFDDKWDAAVRAEQRKAKAGSAEHA